MLMIGSRWTDVIICNSQAGARHVSANGYPSGKVVVIPNGFDTERFRPDAAARARLRAEWGIAPDQPVLGLVARLDPMKDHATFTAAARLLLEQVPEARFVCAGDWIEPYRTRVLEVLGRSGLGERLKWYSYVRDMPAFYNALDVSTSSSAFGEGVSNAVAESMASGIPCVVTDVGDSRLLVGEWGIVVPPSDPKALAEGWREMLRRRTPELSAACRHHIVQGYGIEALIDRTERALGLASAA
jgi:glycosyltransferase involved in cell wall biosynthesis